MAVRSEPGSTSNEPGMMSELPAVTARERAVVAWGIDPVRPDRCPAQWRRPGECWRCDRPHGHRWRHRYVRS